MDEMEEVEEEAKEAGGPMSQPDLEQLIDASLAEKEEEEAEEIKDEDEEGR